MITLRSDRLTPPRRTRLTADRSKFCDLVHGGMRVCDAFRKVWPEKARALMMRGSGETLKAVNLLLANDAVHRRLTELSAQRMQEMLRHRFGESGI